LWRDWTLADPEAGLANALRGGGARDVGKAVGVGQRRAWTGLTPDEAPPARDPAEPRRSPLPPPALLIAMTTCQLPQGTPLLLKCL